MSDNTEKSVDTADKTAPEPKKVPGRPWTTESSKAVQRRAAEMRKARKEMRQKMLAAMVNAGLENYFVEALKKNDEKLMNIVEKASKLVGVDFAQSEEAVQRVDAKVDQKTQGKVEIVVSGLDG